MNSLLSPVAKSNLYTMGIGKAIDERQTIPARPYSELTEGQRVLRAQLIMEEALETCAELGVAIELEVMGKDAAAIDINTQHEVCMTDLRFTPVIAIGDGPGKDKPWQMDIAGVIDGCCDTIYVCVGTLCAMGVPDMPHLLEVCERNNAKFPNGQGVPHATVPGKFGKPQGWVGPDHAAVRAQMVPVNLAQAAEDLITLRKVTQD